jgi:hypothetical protein
MLQIFKNRYDVLLFFIHRTWKAHVYGWSLENVTVTLPLTDHILIKGTIDIQQFSPSALHSICHSKIKVWEFTHGNSGFLIRR